MCRLANVPMCKIVPRAKANLCELLFKKIIDTFDPVLKKLADNFKNINKPNISLCILCVPLCLCGSLHLHFELTQL